MIALIMAGGSGKRFWPVSREKYPKQFINIIGEKSLINNTYKRISSIFKKENIYVVTLESQKYLVKEHLPEIPEENIICEPYARNTSACIALSISIFKDRHDKNEELFIFPADHHIEYYNEFYKMIKKSKKILNKKRVVIYGIKPTYPATGYGYIESGEQYDDDMFHVKRFKEKPDKCTAEKFLRDGYYFWNSGIFAWNLQTIEDLYLTFMPNMLEQITNSRLSPDAFPEVYQRLPSIPIDVGILEKADNIVVMPVDLGWNDLGGWKSLFNLVDKDENGIFASEKMVAIDSRNCYFKTQKPIAALGVENVFLIETDDCILIVNDKRTEDIKKLLEILKEKEMNYLL
ncbi:MAG: mannose-1-phosphate guanylyltransferase [Candidatus Cloacimonetes bacterium]|nr:mannose-1-phosphate guanylyltransferase [Candidatus Cloacimonadota bacterium]